MPNFTVGARAALCSVVAAFAGLIPAMAGNPPPTQVFYVPFPEDQQLQGFKAINSVAVEPITVFVTLAASSDGTVIYYDHWEDGYEADITKPVQSTTLVFGDGNPANGYSPGNPSDIIPAGTVFSLRNFVNTTTLQSVVDFDARDKIASFKPISVTKMTFPGGTNTLLAGCVEVFERGLWGTEYRSPVGVDMPTTTAAGKLTFDQDLFNYTALAISAGAGGATVQIDKDNNGVFEETVTLAEGEAIYRDNVNAGGRVLSDKPVQVVLFTGTLNSSYASRDSSLLPANRWSSEYYCPVSTTATDGTVVFLHNPNAAAITVNYDFRKSATAYTSANVSVPAGGNARVVLTPPNGTSHFGAYRFYTTGANPPVFSAIGTIDADGTAGNNVGWDGGFTLVAKPSLTTQVLVSLGIGRDPYSSTNPTENGNPVWVTTSGNGNATANVYVDFNGDNSGPLTDPNGNHYDVLYTPRELEQLKIFDPDGDQSGMLVYSLDPAVRIAAVWGQDPLVASFAQPGLDVASLVPPMREGDAGKISSLAVDADGDGFVSAGDTLAYDIRTISNARATIPGPFKVQDSVPANTTYVPGSTRYRYTSGGAWQAWTSIPDDATGTPIPLDVAGFLVPGNLPSGQQLQVEFRATIKPYAQLTSGSVINNGVVEISPYGLVIPVDWTDTIYGSIGDRVWNDLNGNGVQDSGENGIPGIVVFVDSNANGIKDAGETSAITDASGNYLLGGLKAGTYNVRVDAASVAAVNVGYGPTWDLDGYISPHVASVTLAAAQDRVDADFGYRVGASVGDRVWADLNGNGVQNPGEFGINGVRVYVDTNGNNVFNLGEPSAITSGNGNYYIGNLPAGVTKVRVDTTTLPVGFTQTFDLVAPLDHAASVTLLSAEHRSDLDFGYRGSLSIGDLVWEDVDASGDRSFYNVINGRIDIDNSGSTDTSDDGFIGSVRIVDGYVDLNNNGSISAADSGTYQGYTVIAGGLDVNASGTISNSDDATNAIATEPGIPNVRVYIDTNGNGIYDAATEVSAVTDANGAYSIGNLFNGTYVVRVVTSTLPASYVPTYDLTAPTNDHSATVILTGSSRTDVDFGYRNDASLGNFVWNDRNANGGRDPGEPGISNVLVYIDVNANGAFDPQTERFMLTDANGAYKFDNLPAGSFTVNVELSTLPQGAIATFDYDGVATLNKAVRVLTVSQDATDVNFGYRSTSSAGDLVWNDANANGVKDAGETGIQNVRVYLDMNGNGVFDSATEPSSVTNAAGAWLIDSLVSGICTARIDVSTLPANMIATYDASGVADGMAPFSLPNGQARLDIDFGYTARVTIGDQVWTDLNGDGIRQGSEPGLSGVEITAYRTSDQAIVGTTTTDADGKYLFSQLMPGTYFIGFTQPVGYFATLANQGPDSTDSDAVLGKSHNVTLTGGQADLTVDAGFYQLGTISGSVFADTNNDGFGDTPLANVILSLLDGVGNPVLDSFGQPLTAETLANGSYAFPGLRPGDYCVHQQQPSGYASVSDTDGLNNNVIGDQTPISLTSGATNSGHDFVEIQLGSIAGQVLRDDDNNGSGETPLVGVLVNLLHANGDPVLDGFGQPIRVATDASGNYVFTLVLPGTYVVTQDQPAGYASVSDVDGANDNRIGVAVQTGEAVTGRDFLEIQFGSLAGTVFEDSDDNGIGDTLLAGVTVTLLNDAGDPVATRTTGVDGTYFFGNLRPGSYQVVESQPSGFASVSDADGGNLDWIGNVTRIAIAPGAAVTGQDFVEIRLGSIGGKVIADSGPLAGVTLTLFDQYGNPVDADPLTPGVQLITAVTDATGHYVFTGVRPGSYQVGETQPDHYNDASDADGGDPNIVGDKTPVIVTPGGSSENNDFVETLDRCPDTWADWKFLHPVDPASGNPDGDSYENFAEFAFALPADSGVGTAWVLRPSQVAPGTMEAVFTRPKGALQNVTYTLEYAAALGAPTVWSAVAVEGLSTIISDNDDCTETVTVNDLENLTGLDQGVGFVRIRAELDEDGDEITDRIVHVEVEGWQETAFGMCCRSFNNPFLREPAFTGAIASVTDQTLTLADGSDLSTLLATGVSHFVEIVSGSHEGERFDIASTGLGTVTLAADSDIHSTAPPFNTTTGAPAAVLVGAVIVIRPHWTLAETFPTAAPGANSSQTGADLAQTYGNNAWTNYWLYDDAGSSIWVKSGDAAMADRGATVLPPGQGMYFNNRTAPLTMLSYGEVRTNRFLRPLEPGSNLVGGGFPVSQSAADRTMSIATGFFGSRDFKTADAINVWRADAQVGGKGYDSLYLLSGIGLNRWVRVGDATLAPRDAETLLLPNRSVFVRTRDAVPAHTMPVPWNP